MKETVLSRVREANSKLRMLLDRADDAIAGRRNFEVQDLREVQGPVAGVAPLLDEAARLRPSTPDLNSELQSYAHNLKAARTALDRVRVVLLARCASIEAQRAHLQTVSLWSSAWAQTQFTSSAPEALETASAAGTHEQSSSGF
jgi:hypothetical protein